MADKKITFNYEIYGTEECNFDDLKQAVEKLTTASETQFETIKKEKWYNRVWQMITFSKNKKDKTRLSEQIGSVAEAQQILMEILVRLSAEDESVAALVETNMSQINKLAENDTFILEKVKELTNVHLYRVRKSSDPSKLSDREKAVLHSCLSRIASHYGDNISDSQREYAAALIYGYLEHPDTVEESSISENLADIEEDSRKIILTCCMEYMFLNSNTPDIPEGLEPFIDEFDLGRKSIDKIREQIADSFLLCGSQGFIKKYEDLTVEDDFCFDFLEDIGEESPEYEEEIQAEREDIVLSSILYVEAGKPAEFRNKNIRINTLIKCEGELRFENCGITYNEPDTINGIEVLEQGKLYMNQCTLICKGLRKKSFITAKNKSNLVFENCEFIDCSSFIDFSAEKLTFTHNRIRNCGDLFVRFYSDMLLFDDNDIIMDGQHANFDLRDVSLFSIGGWSPSYCRESENIIIQNNRITEDEDFHNLLKGNNNRDIIHIRYFTGGNMLECRFDNVYGNMDLYSMKNCYFLNSKPTITCRYVTDCTFDNCASMDEILYCTYIITLKGDSATASRCRFNNCSGRLIQMNTSYGHPMHIKLCEFNNITSSATTIKYWVLEHKDKISSSIEQCIFKNVNLENCFLIEPEGSTVSNDLLEVYDCTFINCHTNNANNTLIQKDYSYLSKFRKKINLNEGVDVYNCNYDQ